VIEGVEVNEVESDIGRAAQQYVGVFGARDPHVELDDEQPGMFACLKL